MEPGVQLCKEAQEGYLGCSIFFGVDLELATTPFISWCYMLTTPRA